MKKVSQILQFLLPIATILVVWEMLSVLGLLRLASFSRPSIIFGALLRLFTEQNFVNDIRESLFRLGLAFVIAAVFGCLLGFIMGSSKKLSNFFEPILAFFLPIPGIAWTPIFVFWFGLQGKALLPIGIITAFFPIVENVRLATSSVDKTLIWAARTMGADYTKILKSILIPQSFPYMFTGFKLGLVKSWRSIIAVELMAGAAAGVGYMIFYSKEYHQTPKVYAGIFVLAAIYVVIEGIIKLIERETIEKWGMVTTGAVYE